MAINRTIGTDWIANNQLTSEQFHMRFSSARTNKMATTKLVLLLRERKRESTTLVVGMPPMACSSARETALAENREREGNPIFDHANDLIQPVC